MKTQKREPVIVTLIVDFGPIILFFLLLGLAGLWEDGWFSDPDKWTPIITWTGRF